MKPTGSFTRNLSTVERKREFSLLDSVAIIMTCLSVYFYNRKALAISLLTHSQFAASHQKNLNKTTREQQHDTFC